MLNLTFVAARTAVSHGPRHRVYQGGVGDSLAVDLFARLCIFDYQPHAGRRGDRPAILFWL
jgi:hypothetical protein